MKTVSGYGPFVPVFPRSVSGGKYRPQCHHRNTGAIAIRMDRLYRDADLNELERSFLLGEYKQVVFVDYMFADILGDLHPPETNIRPRWPRKDAVPFNLEYNAGYIRYLAGKVIVLERKYFGGSEDDDL